MPTRFLRLAAALLLCAGAAALAQRPLNVPNYLISNTPELPLDTAVNGTLDLDDGQNFKDGSFVDLYAFTARQGDEVILLLGSPTIDTYLSVFGPSGELIAWSDDLPNSSDSGLQLFVQENGRHLVVVSSYYSRETGPYTITRYSPEMAPMEVFEDLYIDPAFGGPNPDDLPPARTLSVPSAIQDELTFELAPLDIDGWSHYVRTYQFELGEVQRVVIAMRSSAFDTYLYLFDADGTMIALNDDDPQGFDTDSRIVEDLTAGRYTVVATSFYELDTGTFELELDFAPADTF